MIEYHQPGAQRILELPVYRCTEEQHYREQEAKFEMAARWVKESLRALNKDLDTAEDLQVFRTDWFKREGCPWDFNQIVGWIRLYTWTGNIAAYLFFVRERISKNMSRKRFVWERAKFLEMRVFEHESNAQILDNLKTKILSERNESTRLRRLYVDIGVLDVLNEHSR